jgi:hypothetical protein
MSVKITRREALNKISKTTGSIWAANSFIMALTAVPILSISELSTTRAETARNPGNVLRKSPSSEKIMITGSGSAINFSISGQGGRHCAVVYRSSGSQTEFKPFLKTKSILDQNGQASASVNIKGLSDGLYEFAVVTASTSEFKAELKGTEPFQARIKGGQIVEVIGPRQRETMTGATCASLGAPGLIMK